MNKEMIIASNGHETRVAILEDDLVAEIFVERERNRGVVGNVYKGRVSKVLPGMQSAFVDIGLERDGFLYVSDVISPADLFEDEDEDEEDASGGRGNGRPAARRQDARASAARPPTEQAACRAAPRPARKRARPRRASRARRSRDKQAEARIEDLLKEGQEILVQVAKEPLGTKGARLTSHVTLPGRFLVFMPTVDHIGVSRKIASREERARLRGIVREFREQHALQRRRHHPHRRGGAVEGRHPRRPPVLLSHLDRHAAEDGAPPRAGRRSTASRAWSPSCCATC